MPKRSGGIQSNRCSKCLKIKEVTTKRYCRKCSALYIKEWRKTHPLTEFQKAKANTRAKTNVYVRRGKIKKLPCHICGTKENVQAHHPDYNDFKNVEWLCKKCHQIHHIEQSPHHWKLKQLKLL